MSAAWRQLYNLEVLMYKGDICNALSSIFGALDTCAL